MNTVERLIDFFVPEHYDLKLSIDEKAHTFEGSVAIKGTSTADNQPIKLHAKDLEIIDAAIDGNSAEHALGEYDELSLSAEGLTAGEHTVAVSFKGKITDPMHGLYPSYYEHEGVKKEVFGTQFESHHAREVLPCIDEPAAKATFDVTLTTATGQTVLSNMPVTLQKEQDDRLITTFETSPRMSTYLLAFVVGELQKKTASTKDGVEVSVWATHAQPASQLDFALEHAVKTIEFYEEYFGTPYPLPKSDHVALPDFSAGAMENWGLITYREITLLADKNSSIDHRHHVALVVSHELAHMWFGNLVTMAWWNDLWLNESFATLMEYLSVDELYPEWNIWLDFVTHESIIALRRDSLDGVQAVQVDVNHPDEINTLFDGAIVYAKGARLLRMIQHYIGHEAFRAGLKQYFTDYAYKNTVGNDLWNALEAASGDNIKAIMNTWISQPGFPVVTVMHEDGKVSLSQQQFFVGPHDESSDRQWPIPLDADDNGAPKLLDSPDISWPSTKPIRLNRKDTAHFITHYDDMSFQRLIDQVADGSLDTIGRVQLLDQSALLARGGVLSSDQLIPLVKAFKQETLESVWDIISLALAELRKFVENDKEAETKLRQFSAWMAHDQYERLGWEAKDGEPEEDTKLRSTILALTLYGEVPEALAKAKELYESTPLEDLNPELRALILSSVSRQGDGKVVDDLMAAYKKTQSGELMIDICTGVTSTRVPEKIGELLESMKDTSVIKPQDVFRWFVHLVRGRESRDQTWEWIRNNWDWVEEAFAGDKNYDDFPRYSANGLTTRKQLEEYKEFFEPKKSVHALARVISLGIAEIEGRVELIERDKDAVISALQALELN